jgi:AraC family transcriptional regulator, regulatory protein of adaptative response / methylated-DNA-[protein]-cysteine methyltransferase
MLLMLDFETCDAARLRHDPAFDGLFFVAVRTTGVYCRPICRAGPAHSKNVTFYPSAAAAERHGYRPCLRCRPETAPFCPAWRGTQSTVSRALKLIEAGALDDGSVAKLADQLGIGPRHLSRLFAEHLDASPLQVAQTHRLARAKLLLDGTHLSIVNVAQQAGYKGTRRMAADFVKIYGRPPTAFRRLAGPVEPQLQSSQRE